MAVQQQNRKIFSLSDVTGSIKRTLEDRYKSTFWVKAEMNKLNLYPHSGHCYPELVEKTDGRVVSQMSSGLWKNDYNRINRNFLEVLKEPLRDGIKILFLASVQFDQVHGLVLRIHDIDPSFSLGELELEKQRTIERLKSEGIFNRNKLLDLPLLPKRLAVISVETSKGYADFRRVIEGNKFGYRFFHFLFPALLQGERSVSSIVSQLQRIEKVKHHFDAVLIIRGGGGDVGLSSYNNYDLAREIALFPLPVISGIGHATNQTVSEMVAFHNAITPTAAANLLVQHVHDFAVPLHEMSHSIVRLSKRLLELNALQLNHSAVFLRSGTQNRIATDRTSLVGSAAELAHVARRRITAEEMNVNEKENNLTREMKAYFGNEQHKIDVAEIRVNHLNPVNLLKRGYSMTLVDGRVVRSVADLKDAATMVTLMADGEVFSTVNDIKKYGRES